MTPEQIRDELKRILALKDEGQQDKAGAALVGEVAFMILANLQTLARAAKEQTKLLDRIARHLEGQAPGR